MRAKFVNETFTNESDPINDLEIGLHGPIYRCGACGNLVDEDGRELKDEEFEKSSIILKKFGNKYKDLYNIWCDACQEEEYRRGEELRYQEQEEREREEEERYREEEREREEERYKEEREREREEEQEREEEEYRRRQDENDREW